MGRERWRGTENKDIYAIMANCRAKILTFISETYQFTGNGCNFKC